MVALGYGGLRSLIRARFRIVAPDAGQKQGDVMWGRIITGLSLAVAVFSPSGALGGISEDLVFCSKLRASGERLACYDAAARLEKTSKAPKTTSQRDHAVTASNSPHQPRTWSGFSVGLGAAFMRVRSDSAGTLTGNPGGDPFVTV